jgi:hypothetical protein
MYKQGSRPEAVKVAKSLGVDDVRVMTAEIEGVAKGAPVAVVVGQDRVPSSATPGVTTTTTPVTPAPTPVTPTVP